MFVVALLLRSAMWGSANRDLELSNSVVSNRRPRTSKELPVFSKGFWGLT